MNSAEHQGQPTMNSADKVSLLPCPFCGATPHHGPMKRHGFQDGEAHQNYRVWCPHGCASFDRSSKELARANWNRRSTPATEAQSERVGEWVLVPRILNSQEVEDLAASIGRSEKEAAAVYSEVLSFAASPLPAAIPATEAAPQDVGVGEPVAWPPAKGSKVTLTLEVINYSSAGEPAWITLHGPSGYVSLEYAHRHALSALEPQQEQPVAVSEAVVERAQDAYRKAGEKRNWQHSRPDDVAMREILEAALTAALQPQESK